MSRRKSRTRTRPRPKKTDVVLRKYIRETIVVSESSLTHNEALLREYVRELSSATSNIRSFAASNGLLTQLAWPNQKQLDEEWDLMCAYSKSPYLLTESSRTRAQLLVEGFWDKAKSFFAGAGAKIGDFSSYVAGKGKEYGEIAVKFAKKTKGFIGEVFMKMIEAIPGGKTVYEFIKWAGGKLIDKLKEIGKAIGDKVKEWFKTAKQKLVDIVVNTLFKGDDAMRADVYKAMGISDEDVCLAQVECRTLGINNVDLLNEWLAAGRSPITERKFRSKRLRILKEEADCPEAKDATEEEKLSAKEKVAKGLDMKGDASDAEEAAKVVGFLDDPDSSADPEKLLRGRAGKVVEKIMEIWATMAKKSPEKYVKPLAEHDFWSPFKTGFGLAGSAIMGILSLSENAWDSMVELIDKIKEGIGIGNKEAMDDDEMTQSKSGSLFSKPAMLGPFFKGIIEGSNIEIIIRAFAMEPKSVAEAAKRIIKMLVQGIKAMLRKKEADVKEEIENTMGDSASGEIVPQGTTEEDIEKGVEDVKDSVFGFFDDAVEV